jgi:hypothetical protein
MHRRGLYFYTERAIESAAVSPPLRETRRAESTQFAESCTATRNIYKNVHRFVRFRRTGE